MRSMCCQCVRPAAHLEGVVWLPGLLHQRQRALAASLAAIFVLLFILVLVSICISILAAAAAA